MESIADVEMDESAMSFANYLQLRYIQLVFTHFTAAAFKGHNSQCICTCIIQQSLNHGHVSTYILGLNSNVSVKYGEELDAFLTLEGEKIQHL
jgi:hypothetical protein